MRHCAKYVRAEDKFFLLWLTLTLNQSNRQKKFLIYWSGKEPRQEKYAMIEFDFLDSNFKWEYASVNIFVNGFWQKIRKRFRFLRYYENFGRVFNIWKVPIIYDKDIPAIEDWRDFCWSLMSVQGDSSFYNSSFSKYLFDIVVSIL